MRTQQIELDKITIDTAMQQRGGIDIDTVSKYTEAMKAGDEFPPVSIMDDGKCLWLFDGFHRIKAARNAGLQTIEVNITKGTTASRIRELQGKLKSRFATSARIDKHDPHKNIEGP